MNLLILSIILSASFIALSRAQLRYEICTTPNNKAGLCKPISECPVLKEVLKTDQDYVKQSVCDKLRRLVCCPNECKTPDNNDGICKPVKTCPALMSMLEAKPVPPEKKDYVLRSRNTCGFEDDRNRTQLFCCRDEPLVKLPVPPICGLDFVDRIVGGIDTKIDEFPWTVLLFYNVISRAGTHNVVPACGGSLINSRYVLTAAHCVNVPGGDKTLAFARLGEWDTSTDIDIDNSYVDGPLQSEMHVDVDIEEEIVHENYNPSTKKNDIALLRLAQKVIYSKFIKPICVPMQPSQRNVNLTGVQLTVTGWGKTENGIASDRKLKVNITMSPTDQCQIKMRSKFRSLIIGDGQICAGGEKGKDSCNGDSGGPLMRLVLTGIPHWEQVGLVSFGAKKCGTENFPGVYSKVSFYADWIQSKIRE